VDRKPESRAKNRQGRTPPTNLPFLRGRLLGRDQDLASARRILLSDEVGLLTLTGAGGSGKTSLALHLATDILDAFDDGAFFVSCASITDPGLVASTIAQTLGLRDAGDRPVFEGLVDYLRRRSLLLILDNFEQLLPAGPLVADLLAACPGLKALVTSRAPLKVQGEHELLVPPLALPDLRLLPERDLLAHNPSVALFVERARAVRATFALTDENARTVAEIAVRLDGLPLAIELAAVRLRLFSPSELLARLDRRLPLLIGGARNVPARQRALRDAIAWSYDLLEPAEQQLFSRLAAFVGGCTLDAVEAVCGEGVESDLDIVNGVASLVDMSLLRFEDVEEDTSRLSMLETIREYALERLEASGEATELRRRHTLYYLGLAESANVAPWGGSGSSSLHRLAQEHDNVRAALTWRPDDSEGSDHVPRLTAAMSWFWYVRGHFAEARRWIEGTLATHTSCAVSIRAQLLAGLGLLKEVDGEYRRAESDFNESLALYRSLGDERGMAWSTGLLGLVAFREGQLDVAGTHFAECLALASATGEPWLIALGHYWSGQLPDDAHGEREQAATHLESCVAIVRELGERVLLGRSLARLGAMVDACGEQVRAMSLLEESLAIARDDGDAHGAVHALLTLGHALQKRGESARAADCLREGLILARRASSLRDVAFAVNSLARVAHASGEYARAARLFGAAEVLDARVGRRFPVEDAANREQWVTALRSIMDVSIADALFDEGRAMTWESVCDYVLADTDRAAQTAVGVAARIVDRGLSDLTPRELEIVPLIARGYTNRQIAATLVIAERTAETHARNIRDKIGAATRAELVTWASHHNVVPDAT
jgi:predicted ATPase/DNA-binding CsgD family transcriptional regulator